MSVQVRIGHGYDVHRLAPGIPFMLGEFILNRKWAVWLTQTVIV